MPPTSQTIDVEDDVPAGQKSPKTPEASVAAAEPAGTIAAGGEAAPREKHIQGIRGIGAELLGCTRGSMAGMLLVCNLMIRGVCVGHSLPREVPQGASPRHHSILRGIRYCEDDL